VTEIFGAFRVFKAMEGEEATLAKILEAIKDFEGAGYNSLRDFLGSAAEEEAGGREWNIDVPKGVDAVRAMTVHKAKGLGFPVVIVLLYGERNRGFDYVVHKERGEACLLKLNRHVASCDPLFETLYRQEEMKERVDRLNSLYVEFTRAEEELYVIGVKGKKDRFPFDLLPVEAYSPSAKPERISVGEGEGEVPFPLLHPSVRMAFSASSGERLTLEERQRGEFIHRVLSLIDDRGEGLEDLLSQAIKQVKAEMRVDYPDREVADTLLRMLRSEGLADSLAQEPGREIRKEQEFSDGEGRLFRMDRVIVDRDKVTVIDYKTGKEREAEKGYEAQIRNYMRILKEVYPDRNVEGIIAYVDLGETVRLS